MILRSLLIAAVSLFAISHLGAEEKKSATFEAGGFQFALTEGWAKKETPRAMSAGGLTYNTEGLAKALDADFYHFGKGQGGSVEANIARWRSQFDGTPKEVERSKLAGGKIEFLHLEGALMSGPPFGKKVPLKDHTMLAAIIESEDGPVFVKMTGPKDEVAMTIVAIKALVESAFKN
ncbi:MAG: hypothetical protein ACI8T1_000202 [Verrucomicrobiales bacterium]|jgi:hypothetical protein